MSLDISVLVGLTFKSVTGDAGDDELVFEATNGDKYCFYHSQDCCESVAIESIVGDLSDLEGEPLLVAEESHSNEREPGQPDGGWCDSFTWTFYKFATRKGWVDVRWFGESNGYYSESVDFKKV